MTTDGKHLIASDGSSAVAFLNPETLEMERYIIVRDGFREVGFLNELEYVDGDIYANVWQTDYLVRFSADTGVVNGWVDLTGLNPNPTRLVYPHVLNGVAYDGEPGTLLVTGKNWPSLCSWGNAAHQGMDQTPRQMPGREFIRGLDRRLIGHYGYYGLRDNSFDRNCALPVLLTRSVEKSKR